MTSLRPINEPLKPLRANSPHEKLLMEEKRTFVNMWMKARLTWRKGVVAYECMLSLIQHTRLKVVYILYATLY